MANFSCLTYLESPLNFRSFWATEHPQLDPCFEKSVLVWIPCILVFAFLPFYACNANSDSGGKLSWKSCNLCLARKVCLGLVFLISIIRVIGTVIHGLSTYGFVDLAEVLSMVLMSECLLILLACSRRLSNVLHTINIGAFCLVGVPEICSKIIAIHTGDYQYPLNTFDIVTYFIQALGLWICFAIFVLPFRHGGDCFQSAGSHKIWPERRSSFFSRIFFCYMWKLYIKGYKKQMQLDDLWTVDYCEEAGTVNSNFMSRYEKYASKYKFKKARSLVAITALAEHWKALVVSLILITAREIFGFVVLWDLKWLISMSSNPHEPRWHGIVYVVIFFFCQLCRILTWHQKHHEFTKIGIRLRSALASFVLKKSLRLSPDARREFGAGVITNMASIDAGQFLENIRFTHLLWSAPVTLCLGMYFLYTLVGHACWLGLGVICIMTFLNGLCGRFYNKVYVIEMIEKDKRLKLIAELLRIIKVVKLYAWELAFKKLIDQIRAREIGIIKKISYISGVNNMTWSLTPPLSVLAILATYTLGFGHSLKADVAFPIIILFNNYFLTLGWVPRAINGAIGILTGFKRLDKFFAAEEMDDYIEKADGKAITIKDASYIWDQHSRFNLENITADIKYGQLIAVVGTVGSGKSSLLNAMAGEMYQISGTTKIDASMAYVPQQSWILNDTLRVNIIFNKPFDTDLYDKVINACALKPDLEILPAGDMTEIGERGVNLSGGQKQRVSLARAIYQDKDIYLLDDPLSAVDVHVQQHLFEEVIGPNGLLHGKTRILVTNALSFLPLCDRVMLMDQGKIIAFGPFDEIRKSSSSLIQHIQEYVKTHRSIQDNPKSGSFSEDEGENVQKPDQQLGNLTGKETVATGVVTWSTYWLYIKSAGWPIYVAFFWRFLAMICRTAWFVWVQRWTDRSNFIGNSRGIYVLGIFCVITLMLDILFTFQSAQFTARAASNLHNNLLLRVLRAPIALFDSTPSGRFLNRFSQDMTIIDSTIGLELHRAFIYIMMFVINVAPVFYASPIMVAFFIPLAIILIILHKFYSRSSRQLQRLEAISRSPVFSHLHDVLQGVDSIRVYCQQEIFARKMDIMLDLHAAAKLCLLTSQRWLTVHSQFVAIIISSGAVMVALYTNISPGLFGLTVSCIMMIGPAAQIVQMTCETETHFVAVERVKEYLQLPQEAEWTKSQTASALIPKLTIVTTRNKGDDEEMRTLLSGSRSTSYYEATGASKAADWPRTGQIEFRNYSLKYRPDLPCALRNMNLKIQDGEKVGIVGRTGAGKTSITAGLFRIVEAAEGQILIDSIDISTLGLHELRRKLTIIPQDPSIFNGTIRQNLDPFDEYSDQQVWSALEFCHLKSYMTTLPKGFGHELDEGGSNLSMGQRQLLCLARALLRRTKILVLDEATASVDMETDQLIQETIRTQFQKCTVITIAHRLETIMDYDSVVVLSEGRIIEHGPVTLLKANLQSHFSRLASKE